MITTEDTVAASPVSKLRERVRDVERDQEQAKGSLKAGNAKFARLTSAMFTVALTFLGAIFAGLFWGGRIEARLDSTRELVQEVRSELRELRVELRARPLVEQHGVNVAPACTTAIEDLDELAAAIAAPASGSTAVLEDVGTTELQDLERVVPASRPRLVWGRARESFTPPPWVLAGRRAPGGTR